MNGVYVGIIAGKGIQQHVPIVLWRYLRDPYVKKVFVAIPEEKPFLDMEIWEHSKFIKVDWIGVDSHSNLAAQRNHMFDLMHGHYHVDWYMQADDDGLPGDHYFDLLEAENNVLYSVPILLTGRLINLDGQRYWDVAQWHHDEDPPVTPTLLPYFDWKNPKYSHGLYFNGNQHILNRKGFELGVKYREFEAEDTWFAQDFVEAGGKLEVSHGMRMSLMRMHGHLGQKSFRDCTCEVMYE